jgi:hypothetical protein
MQKTFTQWAAATAFLCAASVVHLRLLPPDELELANTLAFQVLLSLVIVGGPCLVALAVLRLVALLARAKVALPAADRTRAAQPGTNVSDL